MNTQTPESIRQEQILELLSAHIASNDRVVTAIERIEEKHPKEAERILAEHRETLSNMPAPVIQLPPSEIPALKKHLGGLIQLWGIVIAILILVSITIILIR